MTQTDLKSFFDFLNDLALNFLIGILGLYFVGYFIGQNLFMLKIKDKKYSVIHGILAIFGILFFGTLTGSTVGFIQEGLSNGIKYSLVDEIYNYYFKPLYWIFLIGSIPTFVSGIILGISLKSINVEEC